MRQLITLYLLFVVAYAGTAQDDLVDPQDLLDFTDGVFDFRGKMYSGYLTAIDDDKTFFHYYFMTSTFDDVPSQENTPVVLWLNGGPGCSSLQGALNENGPFVFKAGTAEFQENKWGWTKFAHMLYLESPAKVGYSIGNGVVNDNTVAKQNLRALLDFFTRFPEYKTKEFYITGESYAGVYIPLLANEIILHNEQNPNTQINLKAIMIGNGCTHPTECSDEADLFPIHNIEYFGRQGFLSESVYQQFLDLKSTCQYLRNLKQECIDFYQKYGFEYMEAPQNFLMNPYNIYGYCYNYTPDQSRRKDPMLKRFKKGDEEYGSCTDDKGMYVVLRDQKWRQITHIRDDSAIWDVCTDDPEFQYTKSYYQSYYFYEGFITSKAIRIMHFSGDVDGVVPITGTLYWIELLQNKLQLPIIEDWRPWFLDGEREFDDKQNCGNVLVIEGLTFTTIRNAGHMVPTDKRKEAYYMIRNFILNQPLPSNSNQKIQQDQII